MIRRLAGHPSFIISDAFPGDWLPVPAFVRLLDWPADQRKTVNRARWLRRPSFEGIQRGQAIFPQDLIHDSGFHESTHLHNTIGRANNTASDSGGLYPRDETLLAKGQENLTVYVRLKDEFRDLFWRAVRELASGGFGADRSAGKGQFRMDGELEPANSLDRLDKANGLIVLSTFQPAPADPTDGAWEAFTKYGKLGPEFGIDNIFKRPLVLFKPGASFRTAVPRPWIGRSIGMKDLLALDATDLLHNRGVEVIHYAFGLAVPIVWPTRNTPVESRAVATISILQPTVSQRVEVILLERMEKAGPHAFRVEEEGKPRGMLNHGTPPDPLPEVGAKAWVYREPTSNPNSPYYRWSPPAPPAPPKRSGKLTRPRR